MNITNIKCIIIDGYPPNIKKIKCRYIHRINHPLDYLRCSNFGLMQAPIKRMKFDGYIKCYNDNLIFKNIDNLEFHGINSEVKFTIIGVKNIKFIRCSKTFISLNHN